MIRFIYLVQGRAAEMASFNLLLKDRDFVFLTWDAPLDGAIFFPKSTWSEGRRKLLSEALSGSYDYYIFIDGDAVFDVIGLSIFERIVASNLPCAAVPVFPKTIKYSYGRIGNWQLAYHSDEQFQAIHRSLIERTFFGSPYTSAYDSISWWYPCALIQNILLKFFGRSFIQINCLFVDNATHGVYTNNFKANEIDEVLRDFGCRSSIPLLANGRGRGFLGFKKWLALDRLMSLLLAIFSPLLFISYDKVRNFELPSKLSEHFKGQNKNDANQL